MSEWVNFKGTAQKITSRYRLTDKENNGVIEVPEDAAKIDGNNIQVRVGATAKLISEAKGKKPSDTPPAKDVVRHNALVWCSFAVMTVT